jgi:hypothetical protein
MSSVGRKNKEKVPMIYGRSIISIKSDSSIVKERGDLGIHITVDTKCSHFFMRVLVIQLE